MGPKHYVIGTETNGKYDKPGKVSEKSEKKNAAVWNNIFKNNSRFMWG